MAKTDIKLYAIDQQGENVTTTISYVNPDVDDEFKKQLVLLLNQTTTNVYKSSDKITTINLDTEGGGGGTTPKTQGVLTLDKTSMDIAEFRAMANGTRKLTITYNGDGHVFYNVSTVWSASGHDNGLISLTINDTETTLNIGGSSWDKLTSLVVRVYAPATENYTATEVVTFTVE